MNFIPSRNRDRHAFVDATLERYDELSAHPEVMNAVGATSIEFIGRFANQLCIPDVRHGFAELSEATHRTGMYVLAIFPGEQIKFSPDIVVPSPFQLHQTEQALTDAAMPKADIGRVLGSLQKGTVGVNATHRSSVYAWVQSKQYVADGDDGFHAIDAAPVMMLPFAKHPGHAAPNVIAHELTHVKQMVLGPVLSAASKSAAFQVAEDQRLRCELEAYHRETMYIEGMAAAGYEPGPREQTGYILDENGKPRSTAARITNICFEANAAGNDLYAPSEPIKAGLQAQGLSYVYE